MTVGIAIKCQDGIVLASDSLSTFSRGAPVARYTNKVYRIDHQSLHHPVAVIGAGMTTFIDKFLDRAKRAGIETASKETGAKLDIVDFVEHVGEGIVAILLKEYVIDRNKFFGAPIGDYSLSMIIAGATVDKELRAYHIHSQGLAESIEGYGTVGSGAAYAELFLHGFIPEPDKVSVEDAIRLGCYAIKGAEIMDPHVGGDTRLCILKWDKDRENLNIEMLGRNKAPDKAKEKMEAKM